MAAVLERSQACPTDAPPPGARLDLFVFPPETHGRFRLLILAALLLGVNVAFVAQELIRGSADRAAAETLLSAQGLTSIADPTALTPAEVSALRRQGGMAEKLLKMRLPRLLLPSICMIALFGLAGAFYMTHPGRLRRRYRALPLDAARAPTVVGYLRRCAAALGIPEVRLEHRPGFGEGQTYGLRHREALLLHGAPALLERSWGETGQVIALHELGHIVNGDAQEREKAKAVWWSATVLLGVFLALWMVALGKQLLGVSVAKGIAILVAAFAKLGWRFAALLLLVRVIWAGLIRVRELYADWRVVSWGSGKMLDQVLRLKERRRPWWNVPLRLHPSYRLRRRALGDPDRLFRISLDLPVVTGVLLALFVVNGLFLLIELSGDISAASARFLWAGQEPRGAHMPVILVVLANAGPVLLFDTAFVLAASYLLAGTLGVQVQRETVADLARSRYRPWGYLRLLAPAFLVALGLETGVFISPFGLLQYQIAPPASFPLWLLGFTGLTWLWLVYVRALTRLSLGVRCGADPPRRVRALGIFSAVLLLAVLYLPAAFTRVVLMIGHSKLPQWSVGGLDPREFSAFLLVGTSIVLVVFAVAVYAIWMAATLLMVTASLRRRRSVCPFCGDELRCGFAVGRACEGCGEELAPWVYAAPIASPVAPLEAAVPR